MEKFFIYLAGLFLGAVIGAAAMVLCTTAGKNDDEKRARIYGANGQRSSFSCGRRVWVICRVDERNVHCLERIFIARAGGYAIITPDYDGGIESAIEGFITRRRVSPPLFYAVKIGDVHGSFEEAEKAIEKEFSET